MDSLLTSLVSEEFLNPIWLSLKVATISGILVILIGTLIGRLFARKSFKGKAIIETIMMLPIVLPPTVVGFFLIVVFGRNSFVGKIMEWLFHQPIMFTWYAVCCCSFNRCLSTHVSISKITFQGVDKDIEAAARLDGASECKLLLFVSIPLASKVLITGCILSFARALGEFGATLMFAGNIPGVTQTIPTAIYVAMESGNLTMAWLWVISIVLISFIMFLLCE